MYVPRQFLFRVLKKERKKKEKNILFIIIILKNIYG